MPNSKAHCILIVRKGCPHCSKLIKILRQRYRTLLRYIPILEIEDADRYFPHMFMIAKQVKIDEYGYIHTYLQTPALICRDRDEPIIINVENEDDMIEQIETLMTKLTLLEMEYKQQYRRTLGVGGREGERSETGTRGGRK